MLGSCALSIIKSVVIENTQPHRLDTQITQLQITSVA